jgi:hypothetical protein
VSAGIITDYAVQSSASQLMNCSCDELNCVHDTYSKVAGDVVSFETSLQACKNNRIEALAAAAAIAKSRIEA